MQRDNRRNTSIGATSAVRRQPAAAGGISKISKPARGGAAANRSVSLRYSPQAQAKASVKPKNFCQVASTIDYTAELAKKGLYFETEGEQRLLRQDGQEM